MPLPYDDETLNAMTFIDATLKAVRTTAWEDADDASEFLCDCLIGTLADLVKRRDTPLSIAPTKDGTTAAGRFAEVFKALAEPEADEYPACPTCGDPIDHCQGHGEIAEAVAAGKPLLTTGQDRAFAFLNDFYGDARHDGVHCQPGQVRIVGIDDDGDERARWIVDPNGRPIAGWDPDFAMNKFQEIN